MTNTYLPMPRLKGLLKKAQRTRVAVVGDVMLDQFIWGSVSRISPEAPVPMSNRDWNSRPAITNGRINCTLAR